MTDLKLPTFEKVKTYKNKDLNLFVGLYYTISVKSIPNCYVTYETEPREDTNLMQIAFHDTEDYEPGGLHRENALWTILPVGESGSKDGENDYFMKVLSLPEGILTYSHGLSWGGRYLELDLTHPENYKPGGTMHSSSLWHFEGTELAEHFTIHNSDQRRNLNFVTFSNEPSNNGQLMQIGTKDVNVYEPKGKFRNDALWNFRPANFTIFVKLCNFQFDLPSYGEFQSCAIPIRVTDEIILVNDTENPHIVVNEDVKLNESFVLHFLQSFKMFEEENISVECDILSRILKSKEGGSTPGTHLEPIKFDKVTNTQWIGNQDRAFPVKENVPLEPTSSVSITGFCNWVVNAEIPFTAIVEFRASSDIAVCPTPVELHCMNTEIKDWEIIEYFVKYQKFSGKILPKNKATPSGVVQCQVSGRVKASFGLDTKLKIKYL